MEWPAFACRTSTAKERERNDRIVIEFSRIDAGYISARAAKPRTNSIRHRDAVSPAFPQLAFCASFLSTIRFEYAPLLRRHSMPSPCLSLFFYFYAVFPFFFFYNFPKGKKHNREEEEGTIRMNNKKPENRIECIPLQNRNV